MEWSRKSFGLRQTCVSVLALPLTACDLGHVLLNLFEPVCSRVSGAPGRWLCRISKVRCRGPAHARCPAPASCHPTHHAYPGHESAAPSPPSCVAQARAQGAGARGSLKRMSPANFPPCLLHSGTESQLGVSVERFGLAPGVSAGRGSISSPRL